MRRRMMMGGTRKFRFADAEVERLLLASTLTNPQRLEYFTRADVEAITSIGTMFLFNSKITTFEEFSSFLGVTKIEPDSFNSCSNLELIDLPTSIKSIGISSFHLANKLHLKDDTLYLPNLEGTFPRTGLVNTKHITDLGSITSIGNQACIYWASLVDVILPNSIISIDSDAFNSCSSLTTFTIAATIPPSLGSGVFSFCRNLTHIYVPAASVDAYKAASGWSAYANIISAIPDVN